MSNLKEIDKLILDLSTDEERGEFMTSKIYELMDKFQRLYATVEASFKDRDEEYAQALELLIKETDKRIKAYVNDVKKNAETNLDKIDSLIGLIDKKVSSSETDLKGQIKDAKKELKEFSSSIMDTHKSLKEETASAMSKMSDKLITQTEGRLENKSKSFNTELKSVKEDIQTLRNRHVGGGSMPFQVAVNGTVATKRYADIDIISSGATVANNDVTKRTKITLGGSGTGSTILYVSSKGIANGLSATTNDGMAYGPDTPGTTTSGIQEAINALPTVSVSGELVGGGSIMLGQGQFICSGDITIPVTYQYELKITGTGWHSAQIHSTSGNNFITTDGAINTKRTNLIIRDLKIVDAHTDGSTKRYLMWIKNNINQGILENLIFVTKQCDTFTGVGQGGVTGQAGSDLYIGGVPGNAIGCVGMRIDGGADNKWTIRNIGCWGLAAGILTSVDHIVIEDTMFVSIGKWWATPLGAGTLGTAWTPISTPGNISQYINNALSYGAGIILDSNIYDPHLNRNYTMESSCALMLINSSGSVPLVQMTQPYCETPTQYFILNGVDQNDESLVSVSIFRQQTRGAGSIGYINLTNGNVTGIVAHTTPAEVNEFIMGPYSGDPVNTTSPPYAMEQISGVATFAPYQKTTSGAVNGVNKTFVFTIPPNSICVDGVVLQKTSSDGSVNWTGTTTIVLTIAPTSNINGIA